MLRKKISKIVKEDGKEYIVTTTFSGNTIIRTKEDEIVPLDFVDYFPMPENDEDRIIDRFDGYFENEKVEMEEAIKSLDNLLDDVERTDIEHPLIENMVIGPLKTKPIEEDRIIDRFDGYFEND